MTKYSNYLDIDYRYSLLFIPIIGSLIYLRSKRNHKSVSKTIKYESFTNESSNEMNSEGRVVLVTGGCGFLGRRVVDFLLLDSAVKEVRVLDVVVPTKKFRLPRVTYIRGDITNIQHCIEAMKGVTSVIHIASIIPNLRTQNSPILMQINVEGVRNIANACQLNSVTNLIYTSSATVVIPSDNEVPIEGVSEESVVMPDFNSHLDNYTVSKHKAEDIIMSLVQNSTVKACIIRPSGIFGPGDKLVSDFHVANKNHIVIGSGECLLDWVYVDNVAEAHTLAEKKINDDPQLLNGQSYFIGSSFGKEDIPALSYGAFVGTKVDPNDLSTVDHWGCKHPVCVPLGRSLYIECISCLIEYVYFIRYHSVFSKR